MSEVEGVRSEAAPVDQQTNGPEGTRMDLSKCEQVALLKLARAAVTRAVLEGDVTVSESEPKDDLQQRRGVFVTLRHQGELRGCVGYPEPVKALSQAVREVAVAAALHDPRFPPVTCGELEQIHIEVSVLSEPERVNNIKEIEIGVHGLIIRSGALSGLLLPQVAPELDWDREEFLAHTAMKAGLPPHAWQESLIGPGQGDVGIYKFSAQVFGEP